MIKYLVILVFFLHPIVSCAQTDTLVVYDISSEIEEVLPIGPFDTTSDNAYIPGYIGQWQNAINLDLSLPNNTPPNSTFSELLAANNQFDVLKYPLRINTAIVPHDSISDSLNQQYARCSGALIASNIILTASHCIAMNYHGEFFWKIDYGYVSPAHSNGLPQLSIGKIKIEKFAVLKKYYDSPNYNRSYDMGLIVLEEPIGEEIGWFGVGFNNDSIFYTEPIFYDFCYPSLPSYSGKNMYYYYGNFNDINIENSYIDNGAAGYSGMSGSNLFYTNNDLHIVYGIQTHVGRFLLIGKENFFTIKEFIDLYGVGISEKQENKYNIEVYPNPMLDFVFIHVNGLQVNNDIITFELFNSYGILRKKVENITESKFMIERDDLKSGLYFFIIQKESKIIGRGKILLR
jgi:V8-like Glu-specific endopeptidase